MPVCEVLVIGGGPAGSTVAALLAERGRDVVVVEREHHPRFHIGESLLPLNLPLFEQLGVAADIRRIAMPKYGAEFVSPWHGAPLTVEFADAWDRNFPLAYQVRRSEFDEILFRNAARKGARTFEGCRATGIEIHPDRARVGLRHDDGQEERWQTDFLVDASGRDTLLAKHFGMKRRSRRHNSAALYAHFSGASRLPGKAEGNISIFWFEHGWLWFIPLADGVTSIGAVCSPAYMKSRRTAPREFLFETIERCPALAGRLRGAKLVSEVWATGNYTYSADRTGGERYLLIGDAFSFIDPVFSTGVFLAMQGGFLAADTVERCLDRPGEAARALEAYDEDVRRALAAFSWFIYRVNMPTLRDIFMSPSNFLRLRESVLALLAGDVFRGMPFRWRLLFFKALYYFGTALQPRSSWRAWLKRRQAMHVS